MAPPPKTERELEREKEARLLEGAYEALPYAKGGDALRGRAMACVLRLVLDAIGGEPLLEDIVRELDRTGDAKRVTRRASAARRKLDGAGFFVVSPEERERERARPGQQITLRQKVFYLVRNAEHVGTWTFQHAMEVLEETGAAHPREVAHVLAACLDAELAVAWRTGDAGQLAGILGRVADPREIARALAPFARAATDRIPADSLYRAEAEATMAQMEAWIDGGPPPPDVDPVGSYRSVPGWTIVAYFAHLPYAPDERYNPRNVTRSGTAYTIAQSSAMLFDAGRSGPTWADAERGQFGRMADTIREVMPEAPSLRDKLAGLRPARANPARAPGQRTWSTRRHATALRRGRRGHR